MTNESTNPPDGEGSEVIFRACITLKNGKKLYARAVGLKAFPIKVPRK